MLVDPVGGITIQPPERLRPAIARLNGGKVTVGLRPEALRPAPREAAPAAGLKLMVDVVQHLGHETLLDASSGPHRVVARTSGADDVKVGESRAFLYDADAMQLFDSESGENLGLRKEG
jgi:multiple sugar transport system ATP-binding protein